uniref:Uncharacterized protein n=1 Tax=Strombidium inclinatum TaxID=197538 RepID=A0A7S3IJR4_9SPIT|mmetsp:Transcript_2106/g.3163  ORF Transcript_2106/g.3163 Transcript_2106/m.3163 type:complete len:172 (+) Transcript_2106:202-717(+)
MSSRAVLRKLQDKHIFAVKRVNLERFYEDSYRVRLDFDKIFQNPTASQKEVDNLLSHYEHYIERHFNPYVAMHESRQYSNLWGKMVLWGDEALEGDHVGFYSKNRLINEAPTAGDFHEEYPHQVQAWMYDHNFMNTDFNYDDVEGGYASKQDATPYAPEDLKSKLDDAHHN